MSRRADEGTRLGITIYDLKPRFQALLRPLGPMVGAPRRYDGPMGKSDRAFVFGALGLYVGLGGALGDGASWIMPVIATLIATNIVNRVRRGVAAAERASAQ